MLSAAVRNGLRVLLCLMVTLLPMCGDLLAPQSPEFEFDIDRSNTTATPSSDFVLKGTVSARAGLDSIKIRIYDSDNAFFAESDPVMLGQVTSYQLVQSGLGLSVLPSDCNGKYKVRVYLFGGGSSQYQDVTVTVSGASNCGNTTPSLTLGALTGPGTLFPANPITLAADVTVENTTISSASAVALDDQQEVATDVSATVTNENPLTVRVSAASTACDGDYSVKVTVIAGTLTRTQSHQVTLSGATDCSVVPGDLTVSGSLVLGAQSAAAGSSLDIDSSAVLTANTAKQKAAQVDMILGYSLALDSMRLGSPRWAKASAIPVATGWASYNTCQFAPLQGSINLAAATQTMLDSIWEQVSITTDAVTARVGQQYVTVTANGAIAVFEVLSLTSGESGTVTVKVARTAQGRVTAPTPDGPGDELVVSSTLAVGADENTTLGSSIDLDVPEVLFSSAAKANAAAVDLIYVYSFGTDADKLVSPAWAQQNQALYDFVSGWSIYNDTKFYKLTGVSFESLSTRTEAEALWVEGQAVSTSVDVVAGDVLIARTSEGTLAIVKVLTQVPGSTGQIEIKVAK